MRSAGFSALAFALFYTYGVAGKDTQTSLRDSSWKTIGDWTNEKVTQCDGQPIQHCDKVGCGFEYTFTGTGIQLQTTFDTDRGVIKIELDGQNQGNFNEFIPETPDKEARCGILFTKQDLSNGQHTLRATAASEHDGSAKFEAIAVIVTTPDNNGGGNTTPTTNPPAQTSQQTTPPATSTNPPTSTSNPTTQPTSTPNRNTNTGTTASNTNTAIIAAQTADIAINDPRIQWSPATAWVDASAGDVSRSSCSTGTKVATQPGASFTFPFKGSAISLRTVASDTSGIYSVILDGQSLATLNGFASVSGLCSPSNGFVRANLADTDHVLVVTIVGASNGTLQRRAGGSRLEVSGLTLYGLQVQSTDAYIAANSPQSGNQGAVIGGSIGGVLAALLLAGILTVFFLRRRKANKQQRHKALGDDVSMVLDPRYPTPGPGGGTGSLGGWSAANAHGGGWGHSATPPPGTPGAHNALLPGRSYSMNSGSVLGFQPAGYANTAGVGAGAMAGVGMGMYPQHQQQHQPQVQSYPPLPNPHGAYSDHGHTYPQQGYSVQQSVYPMPQQQQPYGGGGGGGGGVYGGIMPPSAPTSPDPFDHRDVVSPVTSPITQSMYAIQQPPARSQTSASGRSRRSSGDTTNLPWLQGGGGSNGPGGAGDTSGRAPLPVPPVPQSASPPPMYGGHVPPPGIFNGQRKS